MLLITLLAVVWVVIWALTAFDILRRPDLRTSAKVLWALGVLLVPVVGVLVYLIARPPTASGPLASSHDRFATPDATTAQDREAAERLRDRNPA
jgi:4-amino-4-deoxy-L-arabinose transferase-like glycosyltransferase